MSEQLREIIFDTETTGLSHKDGDRIIEIGAVELINRFPSGKTYHQFVNPQGKEVHPDALAVHGISNEFLSDKPSFEEIMQDFLSFFSTGSLIAHNASFDMGFINAELTRAKSKPFEENRVVDTLLIARRKFPGQRNSLDALCSRFNIDNSHREKHGALLDSELLAEVYLELMGGRQASMTLEHASSNETQVEAGSTQATFQAAKRNKDLPSRLSEDDIARHKEFVDSLGENPVWKQTGLL